MCLFPRGEISSGQVDKVLIYDGDDRGEEDLQKHEPGWVLDSTNHSRYYKATYIKT